MNAKTRVAKREPKSVPHVGRRCYGCKNCKEKVKCMDPGHVIKPEVFLRHYEQFELQAEKKRLSTLNHKSEAKIKLENHLGHNYIEMRERSLAESGERLNETRKEIGREWKRGSVCNPQKACRKKKEFPCDYFTKERDVAEKKRILKHYKKVVEKCGLRSESCGVCVKGAGVKTPGAF